MSANASNFDEVKFLSSGNGLTLPNDKILDWSKLKAFAEDKINVTEKMEIINGKG